MRRYLVVANQTLGGEPLVSVVRELAREAATTFRIVVPATHVGGATWTEGDAQAAARERLDLALARFSDLGVEVEGDVGDADPVLAIEDALREHGAFDGIVLSTLPPGASRWLKLDLVHRVEAFGLPVRHVFGHREQAPAGG
jgi:hypothetical protein